MKSNKAKNTFTFRFNKVSQNKGLTWIELENFAKRQGITMNDVVVDALVCHLNLVEPNASTSLSKSTRREIEQLIESKFAKNQSSSYSEEFPVYRRPE